jgi:glycosyltransferase involved in cell wall biosynthesis
VAMKASVIIPTYNGARKLTVLLNSLLKQDEQNFEAIIVIDGSTDNTLEVIQPFIPRLQACKVINQANGGRARVRNKGAKEASCDILIFYDDDMELMSDSVSRHISFHNMHQGIAGGDQVEDTSDKKTDIQNYKATLTKIWTHKYPDGITRLDHSNLFFTAANCSVRRSVFLKLNGFDERLTDAEDFDFAYRALEKGIPVFFDKGNRAFHHDPITAKSYIKRLRQYGEAHKRLKDLHPERKNVKQETNKGLKKLVYNFMASPYIVDLADRDFFKKTLPKAVRFKLYNLIIQAMAIEFPTRRL